MTAERGNTGNSISTEKAAVRSAAYTFGITAVLILAACIALTVIIDPFFHYHAPIHGFPYVVDSQLNQNPGMARNMEYDSIITGSSMTVNFDTKDFADALGVKAVKLSSNGAYPRDIANVLGFAYTENSRARRYSDLKHAFIAIDVSSFTGETDETKYPQPDYLYDSDPLNDIPYVLNKDVLLQYILRPMAEREATDLTTVYATTWQTSEYFGKDWVMQGFAPSKIADTEVKADAFAEATETNLRVNIIPFIEAHPETEFTFFFPPYSILYWYNVLRENRLEATLAQYEQIGETLLAYPNVRVFYFQDMEDTITDLSNYSDFEHFSTAVNRYMTRCFADGTHEVVSGGMADVLLHMKKIAEGFDFEGFMK